MVGRLEVLEQHTSLPVRICNVVNQRNSASFDCVQTCVCVRARVRACVRACAWTQKWRVFRMPPQVYSGIHVHMRASVPPHACKHTWMSILACAQKSNVRFCAAVSMLKNSDLSSRVFVRLCVLRYLLEFQCPFTHVQAHDMHSFMRTCVHMGMHACVCCS